MSKKRILSLSSKSKLSKELCAYRNNKKNKKNGGCGYIEEKIIKFKSKRKYPCKKLKGDHNFKIVKLVKYKFFENYATVYECVACKKIKYKIIKK